MGARLRDVGAGSEPIGSRITAQRLEIEVPVLAGLLQEIQQAAADATDRGNFEFARPDGLIEGSRFQRFRPRHDTAGIIHIDGDGADTGAMRDEMRMRKAVRLAVDHEVDMTLRPAFDILAAMRAGLAKTELAEQRREIVGLLL